MGRQVPDTCQRRCEQHGKDPEVQGLGGGGRAAPAPSESDGTEERDQEDVVTPGALRGGGGASAEDGSKKAAEPGNGLVRGEASPGLAACGQSGGLSTDPGPGTGMLL